MFLDKVFLGVNAIDAARGLTCVHPDEAAINRALARRRRPACARLITDVNATDADVRPFADLGIDVRRV